MNQLKNRALTWRNDARDEGCLVSMLAQNGEIINVSDNVPHGPLGRPVCGGNPGMAVPEWPPYKPASDCLLELQPEIIVRRLSRKRAARYL